MTQHQPAPAATGATTPAATDLDDANDQGGATPARRRQLQAAQRRAAGPLPQPAIQMTRYPNQSASVDYQRGGTFQLGAPGALDTDPDHALGGRFGGFYLGPEDAPAMIHTLLDKEHSYPALYSHELGLRQRQAHWRATLPDFKGSKLDAEIDGLLGQLYDKMIKHQTRWNPSTQKDNPLVVKKIAIPDAGAPTVTWKRWLLDNEGERDAVVGVLLANTNLGLGADGKVPDWWDSKAPPPAQVAGPAEAILALQREPEHRAYAAFLARALWSSVGVRSDDKFRQEDTWFSDLGFAVYYDSIAGKLASFDKLAKKPKDAILPHARAATNEYLDRWVKEKRQVGPGDAKIRQAFYAALKDLVRRTKSGRIAAAFMDAMSDVMVANFDDANWRQEIPTVERELRDVLLGEGVGSGALAQVRDEIDDALDEKTKLMDKDIHRSGVEVQYLKLYLGIKQAVEQVGEAWVAKKTRSRRDRVADLGTARTWVGRGINVAWSFCPGPSAAVPVVLAGTIADIFLEAEAAAAQRELERYEAALREALAANLAAKLGNITELAQADFAALDAGVLPKLSRGIFQSLGDIEALYSAKLRTELDQAEVY